MKDIIVQCSELSFSYNNKKNAVNKLDVTVRAGEKVAVIGHNGSGKSTFFLLLCGVLESDTGDICLHNERVKHKKKYYDKLRRAIGYVFQEPDVQIIGSTVEGEISFGLLNMKVSEKEIEKRIADIAEQMDLTAYRKTPPHLLSGGEKKRVSIADILVMEPQVLLFDEPTASLDEKNKRVFEEILVKEQLKDKTVLISSHDMDFIWSWAERVILFHEGEIIGDGSPEEIFADKQLAERAGIKLPMLYSLTERVCALKNIPMPAAVPKTEAEYEAFMRSVFEIE